MRSEHAKYRDTQTREWTPDGPLTLSGTTILKRAEALVLLEVKDAKCLFIKIEFDNFSAGQGMVPQVGAGHHLLNFSVYCPCFCSCL